MPALVKENPDNQADVIVITKKNNTCTKQRDGAMREAANTMASKLR